MAFHSRAEFVCVAQVWRFYFTDSSERVLRFGVDERICFRLGI